MNTEQILLIGILIFILTLFLSNKIRFDVVAVLGLMLAYLVGVVPLERVFIGLSHPATLTVAFVLVISATLTHSGSFESIATLIQTTAKHKVLHLLTICSLTCVISMFMNNVGALAIIMPITISSAKANGRDPAHYLMPVSFASLLGGMATLIGTPPNLIISTYRASFTGQGFKMFDFAYVGLPIAIVGVLFVSIFSWLLLKVHKNKNTTQLIMVQNYTFKVQVTETSTLLTLTYQDFINQITKMRLHLLHLIRDNQKFLTPPKEEVFVEGDLLIIEGSNEDLDKLMTQYQLALTSDAGVNELETIEAVVEPSSKLIGKTIKAANAEIHFDFTISGINSRREKVVDVTKYMISAGDILLLHGELEHANAVLTNIKCLPLAANHLNYGQRKFKYSALLLFVISIIAVSLDFVPIEIMFMLCLLTMVLFKIIPIKNLYKDIELPVLILLAAMIPIGEALESTNTTFVITKLLLDNLTNVPHWALLVTLMTITMALTDVLNNAATTIIMAPIGYAIANYYQLNPDAFLIAVAIGSSAAFLTPIGHQNNAIILGPGGYTFSDYWRLGLPLELLLIVLATPLILHFWPL